MITQSDIRALASNYRARGEPDPEGLAHKNLLNRPPSCSYRDWRETLLNRSTPYRKQTP